jgi:hypothetical protein
MWPQPWALPISCSDPEAAAELAVATETHPAALYRLMRALASTGVFEEDESGRFALTTVGEILRSDIAGTHAPMALLHGRPDNWQAWADLSYAVRSGATAFDHVHGSSVWEYRAKHPEESRVFDRAMAVGTERFAEIAIGVCNFGRFGTVVDIGGGDGVKPASSRRPWTSPALTPSGRCRASWTRIRWYGWRRSMDCWWTCATCHARSRRQLGKLVRHVAQRREVALVVQEADLQPIDRPALTVELQNRIIHPVVLEIGQNLHGAAVPASGTQTQQEERAKRAQDNPFTFALAAGSVPRKEQADCQSMRRDPLWRGRSGVNDC